MAGNTSRKALLWILGIGLTGLVTDRLFSDRPLTGPQGAAAADAPAESAIPPQAKAPATKVVTINDQLLQVSGLGAGVQRDPLVAPTPWLNELQRQAAAREQELSKLSQKAAEKPVAREEFRLVGVFKVNGPSERPMAVISYGSKRKQVPTQVGVGDEIGGFEVVSITLPSEDEPASVILKRGDERLELKPK